MIKILDPDSPRNDKTFITDIESIVKKANLQIDLLWFEHLDRENVNDQLKLKSTDKNGQVYDEQGNLCKDTENFKESPYGGDFKEFIGTNTEDEKRMENVKEQFPGADKTFEVTGNFFLPQKLVREQEKVEENGQDQEQEKNIIEIKIEKIEGTNIDPKKEIKDEEEKNIDNKKEETKTNQNGQTEGTNDIEIKENIIIEIKQENVEEKIKEEKEEKEEKIEKEATSKEESQENKGDIMIFTLNKKQEEEEEESEKDENIEIKKEGEAVITTEENKKEEQLQEKAQVLLEHEDDKRKKLEKNENDIIKEEKIILNEEIVEEENIEIKKKEEEEKQEEPPQKEQPQKEQPNEEEIKKIEESYEGNDTNKSKFPKWAKVLIGFAILAIAVLSLLFGFGVLGALPGIAKTVTLVIAALAIFAEIIYLTFLYAMSKDNKNPGGRSGGGSLSQPREEDYLKYDKQLSLLDKGRNIQGRQRKIPSSENSLGYDNEMTGKNQKSQFSN